MPIFLTTTFSLRQLSKRNPMVSNSNNTTGILIATGIAITANITSKIANTQFNIISANLFALFFLISINTDYLIITPNVNFTLGVITLNKFILFLPYHKVLSSFLQHSYLKVTLFLNPVKDSVNLVLMIHNQLNKTRHLSTAAQAKY